jgi:DNA-binding beta-propeller fold protein YncE
MIRYIKGTALIFMLLFLYSCAPPKLPDILWPSPPSEPRIRFVKSFSSPRGFYGISAKDILLGADAESRFGKPSGATVDSRGRILIADSSLVNVKIFDYNASNMSFLETGRNLMLKPIGIAADAKGRAYVADTYKNKIYVFGSNDRFTRVFGQKGEFKQPVGLAVDNERGRLYVVDTHLHKVFVLEIETGEVIKTIGKRGQEEGEFNYPAFIAIDKKGNIYVVDTMNGRVQVFDPEGRFIRAWGQLGDGQGMFARPKGIAIDSEGHVYVVDAAFNNVQIFDEEGEFLLYFGDMGGGRGQQILPMGIAIDNEDRIYVMDTFNGRVNIYEYMGEKYRARQGGKK